MAFGGLKIAWAQQARGETKPRRKCSPGAASYLFADEEQLAASWVTPRRHMSAVLVHLAALCLALAHRSAVDDDATQAHLSSVAAARAKPILLQARCVPLRLARHRGSSLGGRACICTLLLCPTHVCPRCAARQGKQRAKRRDTCLSAASAYGTAKGRTLGQRRERAAAQVSFTQARWSRTVSSAMTSCRRAFDPQWPSPAQAQNASVSRKPQVC